MNKLSVLQIIKRLLLSVVIVILLGFFQVVIWTIPFRVYARKLEKTLALQKTSNSNHQTRLGYAKLIGWKVTRISRYTPWPSKCLVQALTVKFLLRKFAIANEMLIGVALDEKQKLTAHAWVNVEEFTVVGGANSKDEFKVMKIFIDHYV